MYAINFPLVCHISEKSSHATCTLTLQLQLKLNLKQQQLQLLPLQRPLSIFALSVKFCIAATI